MDEQTVFTIIQTDTNKAVMAASKLKIWVINNQIKSAAIGGFIFGFIIGTII